VLVFDIATDSVAAVIHSLWEKGDKNPLILPTHISIDDPRVQFELTRYLSDNWVPVIENDHPPAGSRARRDGDGTAASVSLPNASRG
jgi:predicted AAA+ superfamily ATPase